MKSRYYFEVREEAFETSLYSVLEKDGEKTEERKRLIVVPSIAEGENEESVDETYQDAMFIAYALNTYIKGQPKEDVTYE